VVEVTGFDWIVIAYLAAFAIIAAADRRRPL
jgi:hypothetical protein